MDELMQETSWEVLVLHPILYFYKEENIFDISSLMFLKIGRASCRERV